MIQRVNGLSPKIRSSSSLARPGHVEGVSHEPRSMCPTAFAKETFLSSVTYRLPPSV